MQVQSIVDEPTYIAIDEPAKFQCQATQTDQCELTSSYFHGNASTDDETIQKFKELWLENLLEFERNRSAYHQLVIENMNMFNRRAAALELEVLNVKYNSQNIKQIQKRVSAESLNVSCLKEKGDNASDNLVQDRVQSINELEVLGKQQSHGHGYFQLQICDQNRKEDEVKLNETIVDLKYNCNPKKEFINSPKNSITELQFKNSKTAIDSKSTIPDDKTPQLSAKGNVFDFNEHLRKHKFKNYMKSYAKTMLREMTTPTIIESKYEENFPRTTTISTIDNAVERDRNILQFRQNSYNLCFYKQSPQSSLDLNLRATINPWAIPMPTDHKSDSNESKALIPVPDIETSSIYRSG